MAAAAPMALGGLAAGALANRGGSNPIQSTPSNVPGTVPPFVGIQQGIQMGNFPQSQGAGRFLGQQFGGPMGSFQPGSGPSGSQLYGNGPQGAYTQNPVDQYITNRNPQNALRGFRGGMVGGGSPVGMYEPSMMRNMR